MEDICFNVYTNEEYFNINYITIPNLKRNTSELNWKINLISNRFPEHEKFDNVNYIESNITFQNDGGHYRNTMLYALNGMTEKYIIFMCDDYIIKSPLKFERFRNIPKIMDELDADFVTLSTQNHMSNFIPNWNKPNIDMLKYGFPENCIYEMDNTYRHLYSVQPCIWKRESLIELLNHNKRLSLHDLDNTNIVNKRGEFRQMDGSVFYEKIDGWFDYEFKNYCFHLPPISFHLDERNLDSDFLLIEYAEVIRHGKIIEPKTNSKDYFLNLLDNEYKQIRSKLNKFF
jgi:hypothetical protein